MKSIVGLAFGAIILLIIFAGLMLVVTVAQQRPLPDADVYTMENQSINQTMRLVMAPMPAMVNALAPFVVLALFLVPIGFMVMVHRGTKSRGGF